MPASVEDQIRSRGVLAVLRAASVDAAVAVAGALVAGGITGIEVAFTTPDAGTAIRGIRDAHGDRVLVGAGTVITREELRAADAADAAFLVSPGFDPELVAAMRATGRAVFPGVLTPSEIMAARRLGLRAVKLFPGSHGGPSYLRALRGPFPDMAFLPTGGVSAANAGDWIAAGAWAVGVGGALAPAQLKGDAHRREVVTAARELIAAVTVARTTSPPC